MEPSAAVFEDSPPVSLNYLKGRTAGYAIGRENSREETQRAHKGNSF